MKKKVERQNRSLGSSLCVSRRDDTLIQIRITVGWNGPNVLVRNGYFFRFQRKIVGNLFQFANGAQDLRNNRREEE